ncbi:MAG: electron transfer flavoprotein subunit alpha/FixB family protein [Thermoguttaceae bacterium]|jgi:electron transfer flavoprotein alpha subunit
MTSKNPQGEVWVFAEQQDGKLHDVALELCGKARSLADRLGVKVGAVLLGYQVSGLATTLFAHGVDRVYLVEDPALKTFTSSPYAFAVETLINKYSPQIVLYGATPVGRDFGPRVASATLSGLTADCVELEIGDVADKRTNTEYKNLLYQIRPAFGGNIVATIVNPEQWPQMATVREGVFPKQEADESRSGEIIEEKIAFDPSMFRVEVLERFVEKKRVDLRSARIVVSGGAGVGSKENFQLVRDLADAVGGAVAASRAAVNCGYIGAEYLVGQTGTTIRPALYIAVGISGAIQHLTGMKDSAKIIAINDDPTAPIFSVAHYGIVGDLNEVIPQLIKAIHERPIE